MVVLRGESSVRYLARSNSTRLGKSQRWLRILLNGIGLVLLSSQPGWAHGAIATVSQTFSIEANYVSGEPMAQAQVAVYSPDNLDQPWTTGETNQEGEFDFSPDASGTWEVVIRQAGHGTTVSVPVDMDPTHQATATGTLVARPASRWASAGAAFLGLVGIALFFSRGKQS